VRHSLADISRAQSDLGYRPRVSLDAGLGRCFDSMLAKAA
jgi:nucleoside-diphosphate-sugar epimerase